MNLLEVFQRLDGLSEVFGDLNAVKFRVATEGGATTDLDIVDIDPELDSEGQCTYIVVKGRLP